MGEGVEGLEKRSGAIRMKGVWGHLDEESDVGCWNWYLRCVGVGACAAFAIRVHVLGQVRGQKAGP